MAKVQLQSGITDIPAAVTAIQQSENKPGQPPLTGVEIAEIIASGQPPVQKPGTKYKVALRNGGDERIVTSPDGTIEDAVRTYNAGKKEIRTAKQLSFELVGVE